MRNGKLNFGQVYAQCLSSDIVPIKKLKHKEYNTITKSKRMMPF